MVGIIFALVDDVVDVIVVLVVVVHVRILDRSEQVSSFSSNNNNGLLLISKIYAWCGGGHYSKRQICGHRNQ